MHPGATSVLSGALTFMPYVGAHKFELTLRHETAQHAKRPDLSRGPVYIPTCIPGVHQIDILSYIDRSIRLCRTQYE